uniref:Transmembrane protein 42-like n=1 Tax=Phallusia mammillata TaxID=59560 RepID=A0A6F9DVR9_9ASCI|nr:transmembrane protein 42-like [Phallusia mammillata]
MRGHALACAAGLCAALASVTGKFATGDMENMPLIPNHWILNLIFRLLFITCTLALNSVMWTFFVESMQHLNSAEASVLNVGCNILLSGVLGWFCFGESVPAIWWCGASLIVTGIAVMHTAESDKEKMS